MQKTGLLFIALLLGLGSSAQLLEKLIQPKEVERIERILAADDMQGRKTFTPGIEKAADFIEQEFAKAGLVKWPGLKTYRQSFSMIRTTVKTATATLNGAPVADDKLVAITGTPKYVYDQSKTETVVVSKEENLFRKASGYLNGKGDKLVLVDTAFARDFKRLRSMRQQRFSDAANVIFVLSSTAVQQFSAIVESEVTSMPLANVIGYLPGKSRKEEFVVFSGHYDHLGVGKGDKDADTIYNGANDDAAGITAVICLAKYFKQLKNNERSIVFVAFTAEEIGGFGSQYFSRQMNPDKVMAMFNIEMIGTESKWGKNSAYITGFEKTDFGSILQKNLEGTGFQFYPDPYPQQQLFYRSDNATLARLGVPAHTISTSKMDSEKFYHTLNDEIETLDMENMAAIIRAIALSSTGIINGKDTPSRVNVKDLR
jgi:Peptidase family M28